MKALPLVSCSARSISPTELACPKQFKCFLSMRLQALTYDWMSTKSATVYRSINSVQKQQVRITFLSLLALLCIFPPSFRHWIMNQSSFLYVNQFAINSSRLLKNLKCYRLPKALLLLTGELALLAYPFTHASRWIQTLLIHSMLAIRAMRQNSQAFATYSLEHNFRRFTSTFHTYQHILKC